MNSHLRSFLFAPSLASFGFAVALFSILAGPSTIWSSTFSTGALFSSKHGIALGALLGLPWLWRSVQEKKVTPLDPFGFALGSLLFFFTDWLCRGYNFFQGPTIRGELLVAAIVSWFLVGKISQKSWLLIAILGAFGCACAFIIQSDGRLLFSDDHGTFLFRLLLLRDNFPSIPFFSPLWNGGYDARDFFATGALNVLFFTWPFVYFTDLNQTYNFAVAALVFGLVPAANFLGARLAGMQLGAQAIAAILSLSSGLLWYRWGLSYGTLGFLISASLMPINLILGSKIIFDERGLSKSEAVLFVMSTSLMLCWSLSSIVFIPLALVGACLVHRVIKKKYLVSIVTALIAINLPWMAVFWSVSNVGKFLHADKSHTEIVRDNSGAESNVAEPNGANAPGKEHVKSAGKLTTAKATKQLREAAISTNPALILLIIPAIFYLPQGLRLIFGATAVWLLILGCVIAPLKPQLELDRMLVLLFQLSAIPAGALAFKLFSYSDNVERHDSLALARIAVKVAVSSLGAFVLLGPLATASFLQGRSILQFSFAESLATSLVKAIDEKGGEGRVLFSGFLLHEVSGGHAAPLPYWTNKPLMASSPFHNLWKYKQIFPASYISRGYTGIKDYLDTYNVSAVIAHESVWRSYFIDHADEFEQVWREGRFSLFKRKDFTSSYVYSGEMKDLVQSTSSIEITPLTESLILKFNYLPFLESSNCEISGEQIGPEVSLIKLSSCKIGERTVIKSKSAWHRL